MTFKKTWQNVSKRERVTKLPFVVHVTEFFKNFSKFLFQPYSGIIMNKFPRIFFLEIFPTLFRNFLEFLEIRIPTELNLIMIQNFSWPYSALIKSCKFSMPTLFINFFLGCTSFIYNFLQNYFAIIFLVPTLIIIFRLYDATRMEGW